MRWLRGVTAVLAIALTAPVAAAQQVEVTLQEAVRRALDVQPAMVQARGDQRNAGASTRSAFGAFLPSVSTGASAARSNVGRIDPTTGRPVPSDYSYTGSLNLSLELFDGFRRFANLKAASANGIEQLEAQVEASGIGIIDRKSTRLNSSHGYISYAVFCLKKKK